MAATTITQVSVPHSAAGYNLTDSSGFATLTTGAGNGVTFTFDKTLWVFLKNDTGGAAVFTLKIPASARILAYGGTITSPTLSIATGKTYVLRFDDIFSDPTTKNVTIECDVAGKVLVLGDP